jgi:flagellar biosynthesis protein FliR
VSALDILLRTEIAGFVLELTRVSAVVIVAPLSWSVAPLRMRAVLAIGIALAAHGISPVAPEIAASFAHVMAAMLVEFAIGAAIGMVVRLFVSIAEIAGEIIGPMMGLSVAHIFDPLSHGSVNTINTILRNFALLLALIVGLHRVVLTGLLASFQVLPPGSGADAGLAAPVLFALGSDTLAAGIRVAFPVAAVLMLSQIALAFVARAAPAMQVFSVGFAVTLIVGGLVLTLVVPDAARQLLVEASFVGRRIEAALYAIGAGR